MVQMLTDDAVEALLKESLQRRDMPDCFLYMGTTGVKRWLALSSSGEFPVANSLTELLETSIPRIAEHLSGPLNLTSVGVGSGVKERLLLEALGKPCELTYFAVDSSAAMVEKALAAVRDLDVPNVGVVARFEELPRLEHLWDASVVLCMLGNVFCNFDPDFALSMVRSELEQGDFFLLDCSVLPAGKANGNALRDFAEEVEEVYRSDLNQSFNITPLVERGMVRDACRFHLDLVPTETSIGTVFRTSKRLEVLEDSSVRVGRDLVSFGEGETITMGGTYKYTAEQVRALLKKHDFEEVELFCSPDGDNLLILAR